MPGKEREVRASGLSQRSTDRSRSFEPAVRLQVLTSANAHPRRGREALGRKGFRCRAGASAPARPDRVSELNALGRPVLTYEFRNADGTSVQLKSSDPGRALITGTPADIGSFKIPTVWGAKDSAPYFHDNSSKTLEAMMEHYDLLGNAFAPEFDLTEQQKADIIAYVKLL